MPAEQALPRSGLERFVDGLALLLVALFAFEASSRASYPFDLEWMEGGQVCHALELLEGRGLYRAPSADFIAFPYEPFYSYVLAALASLFGLSMGLARAVSIVSSLALAAVVALFVRERVPGRAWPLRAAAVTLGLQSVVGHFLDLARVDALCLFLLAAALLVGQPGKVRGWGWLVGALLMVLALSTKQVALVFAPIPVLSLWPRDKRAAVGYALIVGLYVLVDRPIGDALTDDWYGFYTRRMPTFQPISLERVVTELPTTMLGHVPLLASVVGWSAWRALRRDWRASITRPELLAPWAGLVATALAWARPGGAANNLATTYVFLVAPAMIALAEPRALIASERLARLTPLLLAVQLMLLMWDPRPHIPSAEVRAAGEQLVSILGAEPGEVLVPEHPYYAVLAGHRGNYHANDTWELHYGLGDPFPSDLRERIAACRYALIASYLPLRTDRLPAPFSTRYELVESLDDMPVALGGIEGVTGAVPRHLFRPRAGCVDAP